MQLEGREHGKYAATGLEIFKRNKISSPGVNWRARIRAKEHLPNTRGVEINVFGTIKNYSKYTRGNLESLRHGTTNASTGLQRVKKNKGKLKWFRAKEDILNTRRG